MVGGDEAAPRSPGQLASHYAPRLPVRLEARAVASDEALLAFGPEVPDGALAVRNLSPTGDIEEAARNLFAMLRELDQSEAHRIAVMPIPDQGVGEAIRDRLRRAAAPRPRSS
jgi:L-threonylcarbamoyladenylate synthase